MICSIVNQHVNVGQRKVILRAYSVTVFVVATHMDATVFLGYRDNVCHLLRIIAYFNKSGID